MDFRTRSLSSKPSSLIAFSVICGQVRALVALNIRSIKSSYYESHYTERDRPVSTAVDPGIIRFTLRGTTVDRNALIVAG